MIEKFNSKVVAITRFKIFLMLREVPQGEIIFDVANFEVWIDACQKADSSGLKNMKARCERTIVADSEANEEIPAKRYEFYIAACEHYLGLFEKEHPPKPGTTRINQLAEQGV